MWLGVLGLASLTMVSAAQSPKRTILRSVQTAVEGDLTIVTISADGPLPQPVFAPLDAPPRFFLDFLGVAPNVKGMTSMPGAGRVKQVRVALNSPDVTRVVLDLTQREVFRIEADARQSGRIRILIGATSPVTSPAAASPAPMTSKPVEAPPAPSPVAAASPSPPPARAAPAGSRLPAAVGPSAAIPSPTPTLTPPSPARRGAAVPDASIRLPLNEIESYRRQLAGALEQLQARRTVIAAIDLDQSLAAATLASTAADLGILRRTLEGTKPSEALRPTHNLLIASCELGARAARLRSDADFSHDLQVRKNAASAAAGALMLLDRACAALGCTGGR